PLRVGGRVGCLLAPGGLAIITTPNQQCKEFFFRPHWFRAYLGMSRLGLLRSLVCFLRRPWICCDPPRHLHAFNRGSLQRLLENAGLEVYACFSESFLRQYYSAPR